MALPRRTAAPAAPTPATSAAARARSTAARFGMMAGPLRAGASARGVPIAIVRAPVTRTSPCTVAPWPRRMMQVACELGLVGERERQLEADVLLDRLEALHVVLARQRDRVAGGASARGASDPVHVVLGIERQVVVDDVRHAVD